MQRTVPRAEERGSERNREERRRNPRVELAALVEVANADYDGYAEIHRLTAVNVSRGGLFVQRRPSLFHLGTLVRLAIVTEALGKGALVRAHGRVVRVEDDGFAVEFTRLDPDDAARLDWLLAAPVESK